MAAPPPRDPSNGWDAIADEVVRDRERTRIGAAAITRWARDLPPGARVLDLGCGGGEPVSRVLVDSGAQVDGVDASPRMVALYRARFPSAETECAAAETSALLGVDLTDVAVDTRRSSRAYDAIVAIGLLFLLDERTQRTVLNRAARALAPRGRLLFTAPSQIATWTDLSTGRVSRSLGRDVYGEVLASSGLRLVDTFEDEGENHYYAAVAGR